MTLPPLNLALAQRLIARTRVSRILKAYRNVPAADERAIELLLVKLAQLVADFPEIRGSISIPCSPTRPASSPSTRACRWPPSKSYSTVLAAIRVSAIRPYPKEWSGI